MTNSWYFFMYHCPDFWYVFIAWLDDLKCHFILNINKPLQHTRTWGSCPTMCIWSLQISRLLSNSSILRQFLPFLAFMGSTYSLSDHLYAIVLFNAFDNDGVSLQHQLSDIWPPALWCRLESLRTTSKSTPQTSRHPDAISNFNVRATLCLRAFYWNSWCRALWTAIESSCSFQPLCSLYHYGSCENWGKLFFTAIPISLGMSNVPAKISFWYL